MSAIEKLFVQIFERKNWIIDQAEQQTRLFDQHIVSKLLIDGIVPPPWLRNPLLQSLDSDPEELTKDDIVSAALFPQSQSTVPYSGRHCSLYSKLFVTTDDGWYPSGLHSEVQALKKNCDAGDWLSKLPECSVNNDGCASTGAPQMDCGAISPQSQMEGRPSDSYHDPALSLAKLQRSKSRQRALELRNSAKTAKRCSRNDNGTVTSSLQLDHLEVSDLVNAFDTYSQSCAIEEVKKSDCETQKVDKSNYSGRVTRSKSLAQKLNSLNVVSSSIAKEHGPQSNHVNEPLETVNATCFTNGSCGVKESNKGAYKTNNAYHKRFTRSRSSSQTNSDNEILRLETSYGSLMPDGSLKSIAKSTQLSQPLTSQHSQALAVPVVGSFQSQKDLHVCAVEAREHLTRSSSAEGYIGRYSQPQNPVEGISKSLSSNFGNQNATFSRSASSNKSQNVQDTEITAERSLSCQKDSRLDTEVAIDSAEKENIAAQTAGGNRRAVITCTTEGSLRPVSSFTSDDRDSRYRCSASKKSSLVKSLYIETVVAEKASDTQENILSAAKVTDNLEHRSDATVSKVDVGFDGLVENNSVYLEPTLADVSPKIAMDASVLRPSSNFVMSVKPKQLDFDDVEESSMNGVSSLEKGPVTLLEPGNLQDEVSSIECQERCNSSQEPHLLERQEVLIREEGPQNEYCKSHLKEADEAWGTLNAMSSDKELPVVLKKLCTHTSVEGQKIPHRETSSSTNHLIPSQVACENSPGSLPKQVMASKFVSENITLENDDCCTKILADAFSAAVGSPSAALMELKVGLTHQVLCLGILSKSGELSRGKLASDGKDTGFPTKVQIVESSEESITSDVDRSRPQHKKRKTESQSDKFLPASSSFLEKPLESINQSSVSTNLNTKDDNQEVAIEVRNLTSHQEEDIEHLNVRTSPTEVRVEEKFILDGRDRSHDTLFTFTSNELGGFPVSCLTEQGSSSSHNCLMEQIGVANPFHFGVDSTRRCTIDENLLTLHHQNRSGHASSELLDCVERSTSRVGNDTRGVAKLLDGSSVSPGIYHSDLIGSDETVPEFEKFVIQPDDAQPSTAVDGIELEKLSLLSNTIEYPSILQDFRKYAFMHSPSCYSSTPYGLQKIPDLFQSLPNGLLEGMDLRTSLSPNDERGRSLSDCLPNFKGQHSWDIKKPYASPVTLWDKITSNFGSSAKRESLKPELPCISEENETVDEIADTFQMAIGSKLITSSIRREPLAEITDNAKASAAISQDDILADGRGLDSISRELSFSWTHNKAKKKHEKQNGGKKRCTGTGKETQSIFLGPNGAKRTTELIYNRSGRPKLSGKKSMKKRGPTYSGGKSTCNNIVSNITSFIPLVQQKQAAAALTGKRDVKVKALEAAVAAKRIAQKKENERKMKKEAVRLEKERLEQKNLRQVELQKKKKEEERKKKEAEMAAKKRQREEEERKERERKRKRIDDAKRKRQEHEEKTCAKKEEKEMKSRAAGERAQESKEFIDEREIENNLDNNMEGIIKNMLEAESLTVSNRTNDETKASFVEYSEAVNDCDNDGKVIDNMIKATEDLIVKNTLQEQSYEISPYKGSDDEDEDEDDRPNNKFIPSWASKHRLSLIVSSQKIVDPETVFPPQSFCSIAEVLLPRRLQLK